MSLFFYKVELGIHVCTSWVIVMSFLSFFFFFKFNKKISRVCHCNEMRQCNR